MAHMSSNVEIPRRSYGNSLKVTNWVLDSGATCNMTIEISDFITGLLMTTDKYIEVADVNFITEKQTGQVQIEI